MQAQFWHSVQDSELCNCSGVGMGVTCFSETQESTALRVTMFLLIEKSSLRIKVADKARTRVRANARTKARVCVNVRVRVRAKVRGRL
jgi:hypothetical protein